jgi:hypothetical protein
LIGRIELAIILLPLVFLAGVVPEKLYASVTDKLPHFNFAAVGDWDCTQDTEETVDNIIDKDPELIVGAGDYSYDSTADCWLEIVDPIDEKMEVVIADHETDDPEKLNDILNHFDIEEERYYDSFNFQNVHFVIMSDELRYEEGFRQYNFVKNDLARAAADPEIDWIIVAHHTQQYASTKNHPIIHPVPKWAQTYHPLFEEYGVDLILQGNQHNYQRTYPIKYNSDDPDYPIITERNTKEYFHPQGQIFATVGTGGAKLHYFEGKAPYVATKYTGYGILNLSIINGDDAAATTGMTTLKAQFYGNDGEIRDNFTIDYNPTLLIGQYEDI